MRAFEIAEERELGGKLAGLLYLTGAATAFLLLLLPGIQTNHSALVLAIAAGGAAWGVACLTVIPWRRVSPLVSHLSSGMGFPITAVITAATGGADSPARFYLLFIVVYCSYFYPPRVAAGYLLACIAVHAIPLSYEPGAVDDGFLAELVIIAPVYLVLGGLILSAKRVLLGLREEAHAMALADPLTGLANRRALLALMERHVGGVRASDATGLLLIDLDDFKQVNTRFGHAGGDRVLVQTARALREAARGNDLVARLGGDEFVILATAIDEHGMQRLVERALGAIRGADQNLHLPGYTLSASAGWALHPRDAATPKELLAAADSALYGAKVDGKGRARGTLSWHPEDIRPGS